jgi:hypothetical protein
MTRLNFCIAQVLMRRFPLYRVYLNDWQHYWMQIFARRNSTAFNITIAAYLRKGSMNMSDILLLGDLLKYKMCEFSHFLPILITVPPTYLSKCYSHKFHMEYISTFLVLSFLLSASFLPALCPFFLSFHFTIFLTHVYSCFLPFFLLSIYLHVYYCTRIWFMTYTMIDFNIYNYYLKSNIYIVAHLLIAQIVVPGETSIAREQQVITREPVFSMLSAPRLCSNGYACKN